MSVTLVTGATGFVGRHTLAALIDAGCDVRVVARGDVPGVRDVVRTPDLFSESPGFWRAALDGVERVVHVAWYAEPGKYVTSPLNLACMAGTLRLASAAIEAGVSRFVGIGTCFEYDLSHGYLTTSTPLLPRTPYGAAKAGTFIALAQMLPRLGVSFAWCRLFYLYGEGEDRRRLVPYLHERLSRGEPAELTSGQQLRDFLDVAEAGRLIARIAMSADSGPFNICSGQPVTIAELAGNIADQYGRRDLLRFGARPDNVEDPACIIGKPSVIDEASQAGAL